MKQRYLVYLISKDKQLMHDTPLMLTTKGAFCGSFGETVRNFHGEISKAYGAATGANVSVIGRSLLVNYDQEEERLCNELIN